MYGSWTGRSSDRLSDVSKKEGQESAALYHGLRKGRSSERRRSNWKSRSPQRLGINYQQCEAPKKLTVQGADETVAFDQGE